MRITDSPSFHIPREEAAPPAPSPPPPLLPGEAEIERVVRAHLGDVDLRTCVSSGWRPEVMLRLSFRQTTEGRYFQAESLGSTYETSNCVNRIAYGWLPSETPWTDAALTFTLVNDTHRATLGFHRVNEVPRPTGRPPTVSLVAGSLGGEGFRDGAARAARFGLALGLAATRDHVFVAEGWNRALRRIDRATGEVRTVLVAPDTVEVGDGKTKYRRSTFDHPTSLAFDPQGRLHMLDALHGDVWRIDGDRLVHAYSGEYKTAGDLSGPRAMVFGGDGALYVADSGRHRIVRIDLATRQLTEVAGERDVEGHRDGARARFAHPEGLAIDDAGEHLYVAEWTNHTIRRVVIATGEVTTIAGRPGAAGHANGPAAAARFDAPSSLVFDRGALYATESNGNVLRRIDLATRVVSTVAGAYKKPGSSDGLGAAARFSHHADDNVGELPFGLARAPDGTLYLADSGNHAIRAIAPSGEVTTLAGLAPAALAPRALAYATDGRLYATMGQALYRIVDGKRELVAGDPEAMGHDDGIGRRARFRGPTHLAAAPDGSLVVAEVNGQIRRVDPASGRVVTLFDDARIPAALAVDARGAIYASALGAIARIERGKRIPIVVDPRLKLSETRMSETFEMPLDYVHGIAVDGHVLYVLDDLVQQTGLHRGVVTRLRRVDLAARTHETLATWMREKPVHGWPLARGLVRDGRALWIVAGDGTLSRFDLDTRREHTVLAPTATTRGVSLGAAPTLNRPHAPVLAPSGGLVLADEGAILEIR